MNKEIIKPFSLAVPLKFTNADLKHSRDLGCVYFCQLEKRIGKEEFQAYLVISKRSLKPLKLKNPTDDQDGDILLMEGFISTPSTSESQAEYFILNFRKSREIWCYDSEGNVVFSTIGGHGPVNYYVKCFDKNVVVINTQNGYDHYKFFAPAKGVSLEVNENLRNIYGDLKDKTITAKEINGNVRISVHHGNKDACYDSYIILDELSLEKVEVSSARSVKA